MIDLKKVATTGGAADVADSRLSALWVCADSAAFLGAYSQYNNGSVSLDKWCQSYDSRQETPVCRDWNAVSP